MDRQTLLNHVWGDNVYVVDRTVDVHVRKIREKLGKEYIETVKGVGYRFKEWKKYPLKKHHALLLGLPYFRAWPLA